MIIEDDDTIVYGLSEILSEEGFQVAAAQSLGEALTADTGGVCLVLLDLGLPDGEGWTFLAKLTGEKDPGDIAPVIILTAREDEADIIRGLDMGADDYVTKPFKAGVLMSRIRAVLRRREHREEVEETLACGDILLDQKRTIVTAGGEEVILTAGEFRLLAYLMENKNRTLTRGCLLAHLWDSDRDYVNDNTLTVTMKRLREKLGNSRQMLKTVRGIGYKMEDFNE